MSTQMALQKRPSRLIHADRLIIATNRGPVEFFLSQDKTLKYRRGAGGMVTALADAGNSNNVTWVAMSMTEGDRVAFKETQDGLLPSPLPGQKMHLRYVTIPRPAYRKHYEQISNQLLWFLQHYLYDPQTEKLTDEVIQDAWKNGYSKANQSIADAVCEELEREETPAVVMLHDYHLYLAPALIRACYPSVVLQHFIHIPWPEGRYWNFLPSNIAYAIFNGLVGNDILGFQTENDASNFLQGAEMFLEGVEIEHDPASGGGTIYWHGRTTQVNAYPISISVVQERKIVQSAAGKRAAEKMRPLLNEKTIVRVDRIEPTKNILRGFQAFAQMLDEHPELRGKVNFLAFLVPSRQSLSVYQRHNTEIVKLIEEINQKYATDTWTPIHAFFQNDRVEALAAMQFYDVLLVNPIIDGMNLVAKEGPAVNKKDGVLVLSRTAGVYKQMAKACIPTSPTDTAETAHALYKALMLPSQERRRLATLARQEVEQHDLSHWLRRQVEDINALLDTATSTPLPLTLDEVSSNVG
ncbi:MAG TPA: trehalose-6-phosphate synthase [Ktedonobacteraceae bacterium]|nr:trehalose-6-phosphate synthase [Ktedonobacteraceae bacterium]